MDDSIHQKLVAPLNPAQQSAVQQIEGPLLIVAGPGSGKTRVITHRIAYMIAKGIPSQKIVALTFTNKAADEMRKRLSCWRPTILLGRGRSIVFVRGFSESTRRWSDCKRILRSTT